MVVASPMPVDAVAAAQAHDHQRLPRMVVIASLWARMVGRSTRIGLDRFDVRPVHGVFAWWIRVE